MGGFEINGANGTGKVGGVWGSGASNKSEGVKSDYDFGFTNDTPVGDEVVIRNTETKPAFNSYDMDQMWAMAGISKPDAIKPLENTMAFAAEGAEYGVNYTEEDMNLARFMFENLKV